MNIGYDSSNDLNLDLSQHPVSAIQEQSSCHRLTHLQNSAPNISQLKSFPQGYFSTLMLQKIPIVLHELHSPKCHTFTRSVSPAPGRTSPFSLPLESSADSAQTTGQLCAVDKHICAICGDRASGKHYGVYSCEGCKGFFKRTIRKNLRYTCRDEKRCFIDKRQRNRCQYCRYHKCVQCGMKREAVQDERLARENVATGIVAGDEWTAEAEGSTSSGSGYATDVATADLCATQKVALCNKMSVEKILEAELMVEPEINSYLDVVQDPVTNICHAADKQLFSLVPWAKRVPHFDELPLEDQVILLKAGWEELLIAAFSYRSTVVQDGILLSTGLHVHRNAAKAAGVGTIFDRVLNELVAKMRDMKMDRTELGCLRAIILFNPDAKGLTSRLEIESHREKVYASLAEYCRTQYPEEPGRFAKLLLRLPALRSIGLKALEHLFFFKLIGDAPIDTFLMEMLDTPHPLS